MDLIKKREKWERVREFSREKEKAVKELQGGTLTGRIQLKPFYSFLAAFRAKEKKASIHKPFHSTWITEIMLRP